MPSIGITIKRGLQIARNRIPGQVVIQITNQCNALCPQCGMRRSEDFPRTSLADATVRRLLDACAEKNVQAVSFTGGEPLLMLDQVVRWINHAGKVGIPFIRTGTNGFLFCGSERPGFNDRIKRLAERLADTLLRNFWISLDSSYPEIHEKMRGLPRVVSGIIKALPIFHSAGIYPSANLGINRLVGGEKTAALRSEQFKNSDDYLKEFHRRYAHAFDRFYRFVAEMGFTTVNTCYPMSIGDEEQKDGLSAVYAATAVEDVVRYTSQEKAGLYKALFETILRHRHRIRIFSPLSSIYMLFKTYSGNDHSSHPFGCRGGVDFFFVDAVDGDTYPCGYRGHENLGKFWDLDLQRLKTGDDCRRCDWECFRDPSELCAPFLQLFNSPLNLITRMRSDPHYRRLWIEDLKYYHQCSFFDGRRPLNPVKFQSSSHRDSLKTITALTSA